LMAAMIMGTVGAPLLTAYGPTDQDIDNRFAPPSSAHVLGTDNFGRDLLARVLYGGRVDLWIAFLATFLSLVVGTMAGLFGGYFGGRIDGLLSGLVNMTMAFPVFVLVILIVAMLGPGIRNLFVAIIAVSWVFYARIVRGEVLATKNKEFVDAAKVVGCRDKRILGRHILPNVITAPVVYFASDAVLNMVFAGTLGYLGLGVQPPNPEWGAMVAENRGFLAVYPNLVLIPSLFILVTGIAFSLIGDGLADLMRK
jgi:peptide/nickel transport system permease protein